MKKPEQHPSPGRKPWELGIGNWELRMVRPENPQLVKSYRHEKA
ncbi:hypothetical protein [Chitinophaga varians]|nr:hypothetical protein [Chitinophaga varians]